MSGIMWPQAHLSPAFRSPAWNTRRAHPVAPPGASKPRLAHVRDVIDYLDVERNPRYRPVAGATYCNVYAHDVFHLCGLYVPRVWWDKPAREAILRGESIEAKYPSFEAGKEVPGSGTVREMSANRLHSWALGFGRYFGWRPSTADLVQAHVDASDKPGFVLAHSGSGAGHIAVIVPTRFAPDWIGAGSILQSQAGRKCSKYSYSTWWKSPTFSSVLFYYQGNT